MSTPEQPPAKRVIAYVDGQNLYRAAKDAFGYTYPNYDPVALAKAVCAGQVGWNLVQVRFYTGIPSSHRDPKWHKFWSNKLAALGRFAKVYKRTLQYSPQEVSLGKGNSFSTTVVKEKGIDIRIALDTIQDCLDDNCDVALIFSQDQDFSEVADDVKKIGQKCNREIEIASAFPVGSQGNQGGINHTTWIQIDRATYDKCIDPKDYRK